MGDESPARPERGPTGDDASDRTQWLMEYEPWLKLLARLELDQRFQAKYSASDVVQGTLLEAWRCWHTFRGATEAERLSWLRSILAHQIAKLARMYGATHKRDVRREISIDESLAASSCRLGRLLPAVQPSPSEAAATREHQVLVAQILERLPEEYRQVIAWRNLEDLSHAEIAVRLGRSEGAVRMLWLRALTRLREECGRIGMDETQYGPPPGID